MSDTIPPAPASVTPTNDSLLSPQFVVAMFGMTIAAFTVMGVMLIKDLNALQGAIAGTVIATSLMPMAFYFGSSKGSQDKTTIAAQATASPATPPAVVTSETGAQP